MCEYGGGSNCSGMPHDNTLTHTCACVNRGFGPQCRWSSSQRELGQLIIGVVCAQTVAEEMDESRSRSGAQTGTEMTVFRWADGVAPVVASNSPSCFLIIPPANIPTTTAAGALDSLQKGFD
ncbi:uncharacterized protein LOC144001487 [Festucalex cinctus]